MAELSVAQRAVLAQMVERLPDKTLKTLSLAVAQMPGARARALATMLAEEGVDRKRRAVAFGPMLPLFQTRPDGVESLTFPPGVLPRLWKSASATEPSLLPLLDDIRLREDDPKVVAVADRFCVAAAGLIRDKPDVIWPSVAGLEAAREARLLDLARCFDLAVLARRGLRALPHWIMRPTEDQLAELRLLIHDAGEVTPDGGPRMLEILFAHLGDASLVLRLVVHSSRAAGKEGVLSGSEMAVFVNRLIAEVEARVARIGAFKPGAGADPGQTIKTDIAWCAETLAELDMTLQLDPDGEWGKAARDARARINRGLSATLKSTDKALDKTMPTKRVQTAGRMTREAPDLDQIVAPEMVQNATALLTLIGAIRNAAQTFGIESQRSQLVQSIIDRVTTYVDQTIEAVNAGEAPDQASALARVETLAKFLLLIGATDPAKTVRRRAAAAGALPKIA
ncbi:hypothetical protein [Brevundimonas aurifodinae]|uniref:Uncharacterized protein n=2 Tax=Brevundimonas TaxID=41275 RepID=A0ABV1NRB9_9CAUL|nr:MAG: hypothetical protein B7Z01_03670 [Brevundimonas subvibrioides]